MAELHQQAGLGVDVRRGDFTSGSRASATRTPTGWPTRRWTPPRVGARPLPTHRPGRGRGAAGHLDRQPGRADPHAAAAPRADRTVPAAPLLRAGNPELTETGRAQAEAAARYLAGRGGVEAVVTSPLQRPTTPRPPQPKALGLEVGGRRPHRDRLRRLGGFDLPEAPSATPICTCSGCGTPACARRAESFDDVQQRVQRARNRIIAEHGGAPCWWSRTSRRSRRCCGWRSTPAPASCSACTRPASLSIAEFYPDGNASVRLVNQTSYLG